MKTIKIFLITLVPLMTFGTSITDPGYWKDIGYGWVCPQDMALDWSKTIFKASPDKAIYKEDILRLMFGLSERCQAVGITPYTQTETFTEKTYPTDGTTMTSNSVTKTNALGWLMNFGPFLREGYMPWYQDVPFDEKFNSVVGNNYNLGTVYDGSPGPTFWDRASLFSYLQIGGIQTADFNGPVFLFTAVPGETNTVTNYAVCYTQFVATYTYDHQIWTNYSEGPTNHYFTYDYYSTNFLAVTNSYLSSNSQRVNFACGLVETTEYVWKNYWYDDVTHIVLYRNDRPVYRYTNIWYSAPQVSIKRNRPHYQRGSGAGYWFHRDPENLWYELGGGTEFEKYPKGEPNGWWGLRWPATSYPSAYAMWADEEGFIGVRAQQAWRVVLEERYKALWAMQKTKANNLNSYVWVRSAGGSSSNSWMEAREKAEENYFGTNVTDTLEYNTNFRKYTAGSSWTNRYYPGVRFWGATIYNTRAQYVATNACTNFTGGYALYMFSQQYPYDGDPGEYGEFREYSAEYTGLEENKYALMEYDNIPGNGNIVSEWYSGESMDEVPNWCAEPEVGLPTSAGFIVTNCLIILDYDFDYCTEKYW